MSFKSFGLPALLAGKTVWYGLFENNCDILIKILITITALSTALIHWLSDEYKADYVFIILFFFAWSPWLIRFIKTVEVSGFKITPREVNQVKDNLPESMAGPIESSSSSSSETVNPIEYLNEIAKHSPSVAIAGLRIEIEKKLREIYDRKIATSGNRNIQPSKLVSVLLNEGLIPDNLAMGVHGLIGLGNKAAHGAEIDTPTALDALELGANVIVNLSEYSGIYS